MQEDDKIFFEKGFQYKTPDSYLYQVQKVKITLEGGIFKGSLWNWQKYAGGYTI